MKNIVQFTFAIYVACVISITIFPIPYDKTTINYEAQENYLHNNMIPFTFLSNFSAYQSFGNLLLLLPLGLYVPLLSKRMKSIKRVFLVGILSSLGIELTQFVISMLAGYTYRQADIDDVILNTLGAVVGCVAFHFLVNWCKGQFDLEIFNVLKK
ncbi:VanZ family protein [Niallia circulans]|uniref:VanZ family protein n=1 Tax=Niallia circulans TaxID=1397 RepID=A0A553SM53_NIACI|nr:VanZ family protein [Niallia circulans]TRZ38075.1 VanZ family protein [Niallia circulans]